VCPPWVEYTSVVSAKWDQQTLEVLSRELARVFHEPGPARMLAMRAQFPLEDLPTFDVPSVFWNRVVSAVMNGKIIGGIQSVVDMAAESFPGNAVFAAHRTMTPVLPVVSSATELYVSIPSSEIEDALNEPLLVYATQLTEVEPICSLIAETNACGFYADEATVLQLGQLDVFSAEIAFVAAVHFTGEQDEDKMWFGHGIQATLRGTARFDGSGWEIDEECEILTAEIEDGSEEDED